MSKVLYPMQLMPSFKDYIWGGQKLKTLFQKQTSMDPVAESWEVSVRDEGMSVVRNGEYQGKTLKQVWEYLKEELVGRHADPFPLLVKLIDAKEMLSVQVHPNEKIAKKLDSEAKNESWLILDCETDSHLYLGFKEGVAKEDVQKAFLDNTIESLLRKMPVQKNQVCFIPAGTVHAIGKGCVILEVQQSSDTSYRLYDWNRLGKEGKKRDLHIKQAMLALDVNLRPQIFEMEKIEQIEDSQRYLILQTPYFTIEKWSVKEYVKIPHIQTTFEVFFIQKGKGKISANTTVDVQMGETVLVPAKIPSIELQTEDEIEVVRICLH
ncbi:MAG: putative mannose-6-phosphate isomerase GmuF [Chlamydiae bacterium]|nr:putative mannose-6-phosphate isomerase GmuF [Chlamydiota bacterium]